MNFPIYILCLNKNILPQNKQCDILIDVWYLYRNVSIETKTELVTANHLFWIPNLRSRSVFVFPPFSHILSDFRFPW